MKRFYFVAFVTCAGLLGCGGVEFTSDLINPAAVTPDAGEHLGVGRPGVDAGASASETGVAAAIDASNDGDANSGHDNYDAGVSHDADSGPVFVDSGADVVQSTVCSAPCGARSVCVTGTCAPAYRVFVTSLPSPANFGGAAGADNYCQASASMANLGGAWKAWVSDSTTSPATRFVQSQSMSYRLLDGTPIASNWTSLTSGLLFHVIDVYEDGSKIAANWNVGIWTNTEGNGYASAGQVCHDFTSTDGTTNPKVAMGITDRLDPNKWTHDYEDSCASNQHFYCFEQ